MKYLLVLCFSIAVAQAKEAGTNTYIPRNQKIWFEAQEARKDPLLFLNLCRKLAPPDINSMDHAELQMICVMALVDAGYPLAAEELGSDLVKQHPGSRMALYTLTELEKSFHQSNYDDERWQALSQTISLPESSPAVHSMVSYFRALRLTKLKYSKWTNQAFAQITPATYWGARIQFYDAITLFRDGKLKEAIEKFENLLQQPGLPDGFYQTVSLQIARLYFEAGDFEKAEKLYQKYANSSRDYGRALLERAWIHYKRKEYDLALGQLTVLKSSFFTGLLDPERYLLTALIYRDLCHFDQIKHVLQGFQDDFKTVTTAVKTHQDFAANQTLLGLTLGYGRLQPAADRVAQLRTERAKWEKSGLQKSALGRRLKNFYAEEEKGLRKHIEFVNRDLLRAEAEKVMKTGNQLKLLDYVADLEKLRPKNSFTHEAFQSVREGASTYEKLYWPHNKEFWWSELNSYRVLIDDKCTQTRQPAGEKK